MRAETERAFLFALVLVSARTMSMAIRERFRELAARIVGISSVVAAAKMGVAEGVKTLD